jgi:phosphatidylserine/phosphatidylglycerophosphate/cardiolipin synthase-like enzyme
MALKRATIMIEVTKVLRRGEPLPLDLVKALDEFYPGPPPSVTQTEPSPEPDQPVTPTTEDATDEAFIPPEEGAETEGEPTTVAPEDVAHEVLKGIDIARALMGMLNRAQKSIKLMTMTLSDVRTVKVGKEDCEVNLLEQLAAKAEEGLSVRIITNDPEALGSSSDHFSKAIRKLLKLSNQVEIVVCSLMHIKALIIDEAEVLEGSSNFTVKGLSGIGEQMSWTNNPEFVKQFVERFHTFWTHSASECQSCKNPTCEVHPANQRL